LNSVMFLTTFADTLRESSHISFSPH
jgi:hypothetical protein